MLLLIPNTFDGLGMREMSEHFPASSILSFLATQLTHAQWTGCTVWDLIMPSFLFIAGMSIAYSRASRIHDNATSRAALLHALQRSMALLLLGLLLMISVESYVDLMWPILLLMVGLPIATLGKATLGHRLGINPGVPFTTIDAWLSGCILVSAAAWLAINGTRSNWMLHNILPQLGLVYVFAFFLAGRRLSIQALVAGTILGLYWLAFAVYPVPPASVDPSVSGRLPGDEVFSGFFAHWNKGTNLAADFDRWFLNLLPRAEPFRFNDLGLVTLNFIPSIVSVLFGVMTGEYVRAGRDLRVVRNRLLLVGITALGVGWGLGHTLCPIVKSIWTPSWVVFSTGLVLLLFVGFYHTCEVTGLRRWAFPLVIAGLNPLVLYVFSLYYRWWILEVWRRALGRQFFAGAYTPVIEATILGLSLLAMAYVLYRLRIFVRL